MVKKFGKDPKKRQSEDSDAESEDSEIEALSEEEEEAAPVRHPKKKWRQEWQEAEGTGGPSGSGVSTSTSPPRPPRPPAPLPSATTSALPEGGQILDLSLPKKKPPPQQWDSRTPSDFVQQFRDPETGRPNWSAMREAYESENRGSFEGESAEERGKYLAAKGRVQTRQALDTGRAGHQHKLLKGKVKQGFRFQPYGSSALQGRFFRKDFKKSANRPRLQPQDPTVESQPDYNSRFSRPVSEMRHPKKTSNYLPTGRLGYGPPLAAEQSRKRKRMDSEEVSKWTDLLGQQETPQHWTSRDRDFAERLKSLDSRDSSLTYPGYRDMADLRKNRGAQQRMIPKADQSLQQHAKDTVKNYMGSMRKNVKLERGGRRDQLYEQRALQPFESKLRKITGDQPMSDLPEYHPFEPFSEDPLTPRPSWPPRMPEELQARAPPSATYTPMSAEQRSGTDLVGTEVDLRNLQRQDPDLYDLLQSMDPSWHQSAPSPLRLPTGAQSIEMAPQSSESTAPPSATSSVRRSPTSSPPRSVFDPIPEESEEAEENEDEEQNPCYPSRFTNSSNEFFTLTTIYGIYWRRISVQKCGTRIPTGCRSQEQQHRSTRVSFAASHRFDDDWSLTSGQTSLYKRSDCLTLASVSSVI